MQTLPIPFLALALATLLAGCSGSEGNDVGDAAEPAAASGEGAAGLREAFTRAAREQDASRSPPPSRPLATPLPGGVVPDFEHRLIADLSTQAGHTVRQVSLQATGSSAAQAVARLCSQLEAAGLVVGELGSHRESLVVGAWTPGPAQGMTAVVAAGGTYVNIIGRDQADGPGGDKEALLMLSIHSP